MNTDIPDNIKKKIANAACYCSHKRDDHKARDGKCKKCACKKYKSQIVNAGYLDEQSPMMFGARTFPPGRTDLKPAKIQGENYGVGAIQNIQLSSGLGNPYAGTAEDDRVQTKLKTALLTTSDIIYNTSDRIVLGAGIYNWFRLLGSDIIKTPSISEIPRKIEDYDYIFVNMAVVDMGLASNIRKFLGNNSSTKLIVINDYAIELLEKMIGDSGKLFHGYMRDVLSADLLLAQESAERKVFDFIVRWSIDSDMAKGKKLQHPVLAQISHPINTKRIKQFCLPVDYRDATTGVMYHRYDGHTMFPSMIGRRASVGAKSWFNNNPLALMLMGYVNNKNLFSGDKLFDIVTEMLPHHHYFPQIASCVNALEYYTVSSHSRFSLECACLKVPLVSTTHAYNATILFPETTHRYTDFHGMSESLKKLTVDNDFWNKTADFAYANVEQFSYESSYENLDNALDMIPK